MSAPIPDIPPSAALPLDGEGRLRRKLRALTAMWLLAGVTWAMPKDEREGRCRWPIALLMIALKEVAGGIVYPRARADG